MDSFKYLKKEYGSKIMLTKQAKENKKRNSHPENESSSPTFEMSKGTKSDLRGTR
jgi:hypothetical protein